MRKITIATVGLLASLGVTVTLSRALSQEQASPIFLTEIPQGYRGFSLISVSRLVRANGGQLRAE